KLQIRLFARSVGYTDPLFYDEEFARSKGYRSIPCPPHYLGTPVYNPAAAEATRGRRVESPYKRRLNGGTEIEMLDTICAGDVLTATSKLADILETRGSLGPMLIMTTQ